jgi:hypothetical protein
VVVVAGHRGGGRWDWASHERDVGLSYLRGRGSHDHYYIEYCPYGDSQLGHFPQDLCLNIIDI